MNILSRTSGAVAFLFLISSIAYAADGYVAFEKTTILRICDDGSYDPEATYTWEVTPETSSFVSKTGNGGACWVELQGDGPGEATVKAYANGAECGSFDITCVQIKAKAQATSPTVQVRKKFRVGESVDLELLPASLTSPSFSLTQGSSKLFAYGGGA